MCRRLHVGFEHCCTADISEPAEPWSSWGSTGYPGHGVREITKCRSVGVLWTRCFSVVVFQAPETVCNSPSTTGKGLAIKRRIWH